MLSIHLPLQLNRLRRSLSLVFVTLASLMFTSCNSGPARVNQPYIDADGAGELAMEQYDSNSDGIVAGDELENAPGLKAARAKMDVDGDKGISAAEVSARIRQWQAMRTGVMSIGLLVTLDGRPLEGATVTLEPEAFLGDEIRTAVATTDEFGSGRTTIPKDQRPDPETSPPGIQIGVYKVKISKLVDGKETIPPQYNVHTVLGQELAGDVPEIDSNRVVFALWTK